jgi:hypothetical protein
MHPRYAQSLCEFGDPRELPQCGGWILERPIPGFPYRDAMGCYPLFSCQDWSRLHLDLDEIRGEEIVDLGLVTAPFGAYDVAYLRECFQDIVFPFKEHFVVDLRGPVDAIVSAHHRRYARKALRQVVVDQPQDPLHLLDDVASLYASLCQRRSIRGIKALSRAALAQQLRVPGLVAFRAVHQGRTVGAQLWYVQGEVAYNHLVALGPAAYDLYVSFALYWSAIEFFAQRVAWLDLGGAPGFKSDGHDGFSQFKRGWSTGTRTAYFCGRIFNHERYREIVEARHGPATDYFPAYRAGELT